MQGWGQTDMVPVMVNFMCHLGLAMVLSFGLNHTLGIVVKVLLRCE